MKASDFISAIALLVACVALLQTCEQNRFQKSLALMSAYEKSAEPVIEALSDEKIGLENKILHPYFSVVYMIVSEYKNDGVEKILMDRVKLDFCALVSQPRVRASLTSWNAIVKDLNWSISTFRSETCK